MMIRKTDGIRKIPTSVSIESDWSVYVTNAYQNQWHYTLIITKSDTQESRKIFFPITATTIS